MDHQEGQSTTARRSSKRKLEPEFGDLNERRKVLVLEDQNKEVQSNSTRTSTSFSMAAKTLPSSSKPCSNHWNYDVFLSFKGEDTRKNFTDHLYSSFVRAGIRTFRDDDELQRGLNISTELVNAIRGSRISIVVFSKGYASSRWCLDELVEILHCKNTMNHICFPIFYHVNPSDVRKQTGTFAEAFSRHEEQFQADMERVQGWRAALTEAADCSGWDLESVANGYEARFVEKIVDEVLCKLNVARFYVAKHPVGIDFRVEKMKALLNLGTNDIRFVGIYGMGGIGKTTIAKAVYNQICDGFEGSSYLLNIKETSEQPNGLVHLQKKLLSDILKREISKFDNIDRGINLIKERLHDKKVLIVLDDVDQLKQLHVLAGNSEWFGRGTRVIVTTRDEHLLTELRVDEKYKVEELTHSDSLQLFSWHAFNMPHPMENYDELSISVASYAGGLPLALEVLGSHLFGRSIIEWRSALEKLQKIPHCQIQKILRISVDSLDYGTMDIFLDIACFFIGMDKEYATKILHGCGFFPDIDISILIGRSLVTVDYINKLRMHDLIRDMGREIVRERSSNDIGRHSRLWFHEDALKVLSKHVGSDEVEGLVLNLPILKDVCLKTEAFASMKNLRLLQINNVHLTGCFEHLSKELRWLSWHKCPLKVLPPKFHLENLVVLDMQHSNVKQVWKENRVLNKLKVLNLSHSKNLTKLPDFLQVPHLETLILEGCTSLVELHESVGYLKGLVLLSLKGCDSLKNLPRSICNLKSLEALNLFGCLKLDKLPEKWGNMMALKELHIERTAIKQLPSSFGLLKHLKAASLSTSKGQSSEPGFSYFSSWISPKILNPIHMLRASIVGFCSLGRLVLSNCNLSKDEIPINLESLFSLQYLDLSQNNFHDLPHCISRLPKLRSLHIDQCRSLHSISRLPENLEVLFAHGCSSMERLSILSCSQLVSLSLTNCSKLVEIQGLNLDSNSIVDVIGCYNLSSDFKTSLLQCPSTKCAPCNRFTFLPGSEVPNWFSHQRIGSSISFRIPSLSEGKIRVLLICAVYAYKESLPLVPLVNVMIHNKTRGYRETLLPAKGFFLPGNNSDNILSFRWHVTGNKLVVHGFPEEVLILEIGNGEEIEVSFELENCVEVKKCGVHLLVEEPKVMDKYGSAVQYVDSCTGTDDKVSEGEAVADDEVSKRDIVVNSEVFENDVF